MTKVRTIAYYTAKEVLQSKILINVVLLGLALVVLTFVAYGLTYGDPSRVALNFGLGSLSISSLGIALFFGVGLISKELSERTIYMIISRPVDRWQFVLGRFAGLGGVLLINILILGLFTALVYYISGGEFISLGLWAVAFIALESFLIMAIVSLLSLLTGNIPAVIYTILLYLAGSALDTTQLTLFVAKRPLLKGVLELYEVVLPAFYKFNLKDYVVYKSDLSLSYLGMTYLHGLFYLTTCILLTVFVFKRKDLN